MVRCNIRLRDDKTSYVAGEILKGTIELHLNEPKKIRGLYFIVYGAARCHWTEKRTYTTGTGKNRKTHTRTIHYEGKDVYLNQKTYLFGSSGADAVEIAGGLYSYDFECPLPPQLPASFAAIQGRIQYHIEAVLDIPWSFDKEVKLNFEVSRVVDLNSNPELKIASKSEEMKTFCCCCCESEPLFMTVTIPYSGYTPGQIIPVVIEYNNQSDVPIYGTCVTLKRIIHLNSQTPERKTKLEHASMVEKNERGVAVEMSVKIISEILIPPTMVHSNSQYCNAVQVFYEITIEARVDGCHSNVMHSFPITIGSIPLQFNTPQSMPPFIGNAIAPSAPMAFTDPMPDAPPSFDEAMKLTNEKLETTRNGFDIALQPTAPATDPMDTMGWKFPLDTLEI